MWLPKISSKKLGIDLGTANSLVWSSGEGIVLSEPSVVATDADDGKIIAIGEQAYQMLGRTGGNLIAQKPLKDGVVADYLVCEVMLKYFIDKILHLSRFARPEVMVCVPYGITQVERRAVLEATMAAGARTAYLIDTPLAAAIGTKLPIDEALGSMIIDIGAGQVGAAVVSLGGIVAAGSAKAGGDKINEAITIHLRRMHNLIIGEKMAEDIKINIGSAISQVPKKTMEVKGRDAVTGLPKTTTVDTNEITDAILPLLNIILNCIKGVLESTPPELASDIIDRGIILTGGTSQLRALDRFISNQIGVSAHLADEPLKSVVWGTGTALENMQSWRRYIHER